MVVSEWVEMLGDVLDKGLRVVAMFHWIPESVFIEGGALWVFLEDKGWCRFM